LKPKSFAGRDSSVTSEVSIAIDRDGARENIGRNGYNFFITAILPAGWIDHQARKLPSVSFFIKSLICILLVLIATLAGGCQHTRGSLESTEGSIFATRRYSKFLPSGGGFGQAEGLREGVQVEMIRRGWGFSLVRLRDGRAGEVASEDLQKDNRGWIEEPGDKVSNVITHSIGVEAKDGSSEEDVFYEEPVEPELPEW